MNLSLCNTPINFLDYGCGTGSLCESLNNFFPKASYFGVDVSGEMIKKAQSKYHGQGVFDEIGSKKWKERVYNIIFAAGVFHHIPHEKHKNILHQLMSVLAPDGKILIWEHNPINPFTQKIVKSCDFDREAVLIPAWQMKSLMVEAKLLPVRIVYTTFFPKFLEFLIPMEQFLEWFPLGGQYVAIGENRS